MEKHINVVFQAISDNAESEGASSEEKIRKIMHAMENYKEQIKDLEERTIPITPPEVISQRE
jgi:flagellar biosynthesis chaperone FliJ